MKKIVFGLIVCAALVAGCKGLDDQVGYNYETDTVSAESNLESAKEVAKGVGGPYGEIAALVLAAVGAGYIAVRKIQRKVAGKGTPQIKQ